MLNSSFSAVFCDIHHEKIIFEYMRL